MDVQENATYWRKCSTCKSPIGFNHMYWICSVSTCTRGATNFVFCGLNCFDAHIPTMNHRDSGAYERQAPTREQYQQSGGTEPSVAATPRRVVVDSPAGAPAVATRNATAPRDILIVASKLKAYIRAVSEMNTSESVMEALSDKVRALADGAIEHARADGRKTVMDRDF